MIRLRMGDRSLRVRDEGQSDRRSPLVFVHGAGASSAVWMDEVRRFSTTRRVLAPDLPGHGQSDLWHPPAEISIAMYRDAVGTMCSHLKLERVVLVGHSMGGQIALACAAAWPERVAGLVMVASASKMAVAPALLQTLEASKELSGESLTPLLWSPATEKELVSRWSTLVWTADKEIGIADLRAVAGFEGDRLADKVRAPTLVLGGADDVLVSPTRLRKTAEQIPGADLHILERAGHQVMREQTEQVWKKLDDFLIAL